MKSGRYSFIRNCFVAVMLLAACFLSSTLMNAAELKGNSNLDSFKWLAGNWQTKSGDTHFEEHWIAPAGGMMIGIGREVKGEQLEFFEYLRLESKADGIYYVAQPFGKTQTDFKLTTNTDSVSVFENPDHDFPNRIEYTRKPDGTLVVRGSGTENQREKSFQFILYKD
jgi:hypothetical protein